jgi:hypothetical protein
MNFKKYLTTNFDIDKIGELKSRRINHFNGNGLLQSVSVDDLERFWKSAIEDFLNNNGRDGFINIYDRSIIFCETESELEIFCTGEEIRELVPAKIFFTLETKNAVSNI